MQPPARLRCGQAAWLASSAFLAGWFVWHHAKTGFFLVTRSVRYNAQPSGAVRILAAFGHRLLHLTAHMNLFVPVLMTIAALMLNPRTDAEGHERLKSARWCCGESSLSCW